MMVDSLVDELAGQLVDELAGKLVDTKAEMRVVDLVEHLVDTMVWWWVV